MRRVWLGHRGDFGGTIVDSGTIERPWVKKSMNRKTVELVITSESFEAWAAEGTFSLGGIGLRQIAGFHILCGEERSPDFDTEWAGPVATGLRPKSLALHRCRPDDQRFVDRVGGYFARRGSRVVADYVVLGPRPVHERLRGSLPSFDEAIRAVGEGSPARRIVRRVLVPLWPETIASVFDLWYMLVEHSLPFLVTLGRVERFAKDQWYLAMEFLENLLWHSATPASDRERYLGLRAAMELVRPGVLDRAPRYVLAAGEQRVLGQAIEEGFVSPLPGSVPLSWRLRWRARRLKLDKLGGAFLGVAQLASLTSGGRERAQRGERSLTSPRVLVIGWYGTETAGDKAILGGLLQGMLADLPGLRGSVASSLPFYTRQTLEELGLSNQFDVVPLSPKALKPLVATYDLVLVGGGPLMDLVEMFDLLRILAHAWRHGLPTGLAGCGIGPAKWSLMRRVIGEMVARSSGTVVRDLASREQLADWKVPLARVQTGRDPALSYVGSLPHAQVEASGGRPTVGMAVRDWPWKFGRQLGRPLFEARRAQLVGLWANAADWCIEDLGASVQFIPMLTLHIGGDDRWIQAEVVSAMRSSGSVMQHVSSYSAADIYGMISCSDLVVAMRYHSVLFSAAACVPFVAIDYTYGGKVAAFMKELGMSQWLLNLESLSGERLREVCHRLWEQRETVRAELDVRRPALMEASLTSSAMAVSLLREPPIA